MKKVHKLLSLMLAVVMLFACVGLTACSKDETQSTGSTGADGSTLVIGGIGPLTGQYANYGIHNRNGVALAVKEINEAGGVNGFQLKLEFQDSEGDSDSAAAAYGKLIDMGMKVSLGGTLSGETQSVVAAAKEDGLLVLTPTGSSKACIEGSNAAFRVCFNDPQQGTASADFIKDNELGTKVAVFYASDNDYSKGLYEKFKEEADKIGLEIVTTQTFTDGTKTDFSTQINTIKDSGAELVFIPIYAAEAATFLTQAKGKLADGMYFFGCDGLDGILGKIADPKYAENVLMLTPFAADDPAENVQKFVDAYKKAYNNEVPDQFAAYGYDAIYVIAEALRKANLTSTDMNDFNTRIIAAMTQIEVSGVTGTMTWTEDGETQKAAKAMIIKDGVAVAFQK